MKEYIIENLTSQEKQKLYESIEADYINWYPDGLLSGSSDIAVNGTEEDVTKILTIIGRKRGRGMTLDKAIRHAEEVAYEQDIKAGFETDNQIYIMSEEEREKCRECAKEHRQLAEWLRELKVFQEGSDLDGYSSRLWKNAYNRGWQDALVKAVDEAYDVNIDGEVFRCVQVETLIGLGMKNDT